MKAQKLFRKLINDSYDEYARKKAEGGLIGWCTSNFPQEIPECLGLTVVHPENHAALLASSGEGQRFIEAAENAGYSNDLCSYAKINLGYCESFDSDIRNIPPPDYLLCSNNTCHQLMKWFELLSARFDIPLFFLDIPYTMEKHVDDTAVRYIKEQCRDLINRLCKFTGAVFQENEFARVMDISSRTGQAWLDIAELAGTNPSPMNGFDLFVYMAAAVCLRGRQETLNVFNALKAELSAYIASGRSTYPAKQSYRILYEGIACWPYLYQMQLPLIAQGINMVGSMYVNTFGIVYEGLDEMARAYAEIPNSVPLSLGLEMRKQLVRRTKPDGIVLHISRCCKIWCGTYYEMERHFADAGVATMTFDGDQADARNFSPAQYETRLQAFKEIIEDNRRG